MGNIVEEKKKQIMEYYLLQKKFEDIFKAGFNKLYKYSYNFFDKITNPYDKTLEQELYIIDINWIDYWKTYTNYHQAKSYLIKYC